MQKRRRYKILSFASVLLFIGGVACKKPAHIGQTDLHGDAPAIVLSASLSDSLPAKTLTELQIEDVQGIKVKYGNGLHSSYFEYDADPESLLAKISYLPFSKYTVRADTTCRPVAFAEVEFMRSHLTHFETENAAFFWDATSEAYHVYECIKTPLRHTLLISKNSNRVLHRIEFLG